MTQTSKTSAGYPAAAQSAEQRAVPRTSAKCRDPRLYHPPEEGRRVLSRDHEVDHRQRDHRVDEEAANDSQHVEAQHLRRLPEVLDAHDLADDQAHDTEGGVPK